MDATTIRGRFQAVPQTLSDGEEGPVQVDNTGRLIVTSSAGGVEAGIARASFYG